MRASPDRLWIGVDAGTSGCKATLVSDRGVCAAHTVRYPTERRADGAVTQDAWDWVEAMQHTVRAVMTGVDPAQVGGISVTAPAHNAVLVDDAGCPTQRVVLWSDSRPAAVAAELSSRYGEAFYDRTLVRLGPGWTLPQLAWMHRQNRALWHNVRWMLLGKDFLRFMLTDEVATDPSDAAGTGLYDPVREQWLDDVCGDVNIPRSTLPDIRPAQASGGSLTPTAAQQLGLPRGLPVVVGATDTAAELWSVGATEAGQGIIKVASSGTVVRVDDSPTRDSRLLCYPHAREGFWYSLGATNTAATASAWLESLMRPAGVPDAAPPNLDAVARIPPGADGLLFLPFLEGERTPHWDPHLRGAFLGLSTGHTHEHLRRAVLEGVAFALKSCLEVYTEWGMTVDLPALTGGALENAAWRSVLLSALGVSGQVVKPAGPAVGAAMLAASVDGVDAGTFASMQHRAVEHPNALWRATYDRMYDIYVDGVQAAKQTSHQLSDVAKSV